VKEQPSKLVLEELDGARQGGLRHVALLACPREIQLPPPPRGNNEPGAFP
jgi:hypothetical protein